MTTWTVTDRASGEVVHAYTADEPVEWPGMEYATCNHVKAPEIAAAPASRRVTKQQFIDLLGTAAVAFILTAAKTDIGVEMWVKRLELTTPDPDGTSIDLDDPRTVGGVRSLEPVLSAAGVVEAGWADEVLSGNGL